ncbi:extracellular solute-binding protein [Jannaschia sp. R86511]|uniref:extracellular solute-binding protein n=1 Tax=Jannaschia sp. R86511 TaxID=3093853 RepID=UPI0036D3B0D4
MTVLAVFVILGSTTMLSAERTRAHAEQRQSAAVVEGLLLLDIVSGDVNESVYQAVLDPDEQASNARFEAAAAALTTAMEELLSADISELDGDARRELEALRPPARSYLDQARQLVDLGNADPDAVTGRLQDIEDSQQALSRGSKLRPKYIRHARLNQVRLSSCMVDPADRPPRSRPHDGAIAMNRKYATRLMGGLVAGTLVLAACGSDDEATPDQPTAEAATDTTADTTTDTTGDTSTADADGNGIVTVYTGRHYGIEPVFDDFTADTGIEVRFTTGNDPELRERLLAEGENTPADVVMTADAANIELAAEAGALASVESDVLTETIPEELRSERNDWFTLSQRARVVIHSTERVDDPPTTYAGVGDPEWAGRICLRPSTHPYTQSLVASLVIAEGEERATEIVQSWVDNDPLYIDSDTDIYHAVADGECDVAIANTYYLGRLLTEDPEFPVAIVWPEQDGRGAHVNVSTAAVTANAPNPENALALIEWLATDGQQQFADANFEFPADPSVEPNEIVTAWGAFEPDLPAVRQLGANQPTATEILSATGYE